MKKFIIILFALGLSTFSSYSQEEINSNQDTENMPEIYFENTSHDYGTIEYNSDGICEFTFKNVGNQPLLLTNVQATCGCTSPTWPKSPIEKGKTGTIVVKYNTKITGGFSKSIRIYSNAKTNLVNLKITGTVAAQKAIEN